MQQKTNPNFQNETGMRLWKKVNSIPNTEDEKSTEKSLGKTFKTQIKASETPQNQIKYEPLAQFLQRVHHRMNYQGQDSQSQIVERLSLEWPEQSFQKCQSIFAQKKLIFSEELAMLNQGWRTERNSGSQTGSLKELNNLSELQTYLSKVNPLVADQLQDLMNENERLAQECHCTRYNDKKTTLRLQLLNNQIHMLEKKHQELLNQNDKLKKDTRSIKTKKINLKISTETCTYNYLSEITELQKKMEMENNNQSPSNNEQSNISESGNNSKSPDKIELQSSILFNRNSSTTSIKSTKQLHLNYHDYNVIASEIFGVPKRSARLTRKT